MASLYNLGTYRMENTAFKNLFRCCARIRCRRYVFIEPLHAADDLLRLSGVMSEYLNSVYGLTRSLFGIFEAITSTPVDGNDSNLYPQTGGLLHACWYPKLVLPLL
jgi:hypothetical protein